MTIGYVYIWEPSEKEATGGRLRAGTVELPHLRRATNSQAGLRGRYVDVFNFDGLDEAVVSSSTSVPLNVRSTQPDEVGNYVFDPSAGGLLGGGEGRMSASRFAAVNAYYHISLMAERIESVLFDLGEKSLPKVQAVVNAHEPRLVGLRKSRYAGATKYDLEPVADFAYHYPVKGNGDRSGWLIPRYGELLFGPGSILTDDGWLSRISGVYIRAMAIIWCGIPLIFRLTCSVLRTQS
jgi:hypothetical protein